MWKTPVRPLKSDLEGSMISAYTVGDRQWTTATIYVSQVSDDNSEYIRRNYNFAICLRCTCFVKLCDFFSSVRRLPCRSI